MMSGAVKNFHQKLRAITMMGFMDERERDFQRKRKIYWGKIYDDLHPWDTDGVKMKDKKPLVRVRLTKLAVDTANSYLFADAQGPRFESADDDDVVTNSIKELRMTSGMRFIEHEVCRRALLCSSSAMGFHVHNGRFDAEVIETSAARPIFGRDDKLKAQELGIDYDDLLELDEYWRTYDVEPLTGRQRETLHRRRWTYDATIEYHPIDAGSVQRPEDLAWRVDEERSVQHNLGFVCAEWVPNGLVAHDIDGTPLVDEDEWSIENELNYVLSQCVRGVQYNGEPLLAFLNSSAKAASITRGGGNTIAIDPGGSGQHGADVRLLELSGTGQEVQLALVRHLREQFMAVTRIVLHDPENWAGALSGVALERLLQPTVALTNFLRPFYGHRYGRFLAKMHTVSTGARGAENIPLITAQWPDVIQPTNEDKRAIVEAVNMAESFGYIRYKDAVNTVAPLFSIEDVDNYIEQIEDEVIARGTVGGIGAPPPVDAPGQFGD